MLAFRPVTLLEKDFNTGFLFCENNLVLKNASELLEEMIAQDFYVTVAFKTVETQ